MDGDGVHNVPETQAAYLSDRGLPADASFIYTSTGEKLAASDLLFENRVLDRDRPLEDIVATAYLSKTMDIADANHNFTVGFF